MQVVAFSEVDHDSSEEQVEEQPSSTNSNEA